MYEFSPIPTQYVRANEPREIPALARYLKNPIGLTSLAFKGGAPPAAFDTEEVKGKKNTRIENGDLYYKLKTVKDTHLVVVATWTVDGETIEAEEIINFKVVDEEVAETLAFEWNWFGPITVFVDNTGAFSGVIASDIDDNLNNPAGAKTTFSVASKSPSINSATLTAENGLSISVTGITANVNNAFVVVRAVATIGEEETPRTVEEQIDIRLVVNTVDLDAYATREWVAANSITVAQSNAILANTAKTGITEAQSNAIIANTAKTGIAEAQSNAIIANTAKTGITTAQSNAIKANTAKVGITTAQASHIVANTAKKGITTAQSNAIVANTAKTGITSQQITDISNNKRKVGITTAQSNAIVANTRKVGITSQQITDISNNKKKVGITTAQANTIVANKANITTNASRIAINTRKVGITTAQSMPLSLIPGRSASLLSRS